MNSLKRCLSVCMSLLLALTIIGVQNVQAAGISLNVTKKTMKVGQSFTFKVNHSLSHVAKSTNTKVLSVNQKTKTSYVKKRKKVTIKKKVKNRYVKKKVWRTYKVKKVTKVKNTFLVKAKKNGKANVRVVYKNKNYDCKVTVTKAVSQSSQPISVGNRITSKPKTTYTCSRSTVDTMYVGQTVKLGGQLGGEGAYVTNKPSVALVDAKTGLVMPIGNGQATIKNTKTNKSKTITVKDPGNVEVGIDVSYHNATVNYKSAKNNGIDFVVIRGGNGYKKRSTTNAKGVDLNLKKNIDGCEAAGLKYGFYWYLQSNSGSGKMTEEHARMQATAMADALDSYKSSMKHFTLPIYLDLEQHTALLVSESTSQEAKKENAAFQKKLCEAFIQVLLKRGYNNIGIYASRSWYNDYLQDEYFVEQFASRWLANYQFNSSSSSTMIPTFKYNNKSYYPDIWQTGDNFKVSFNGSSAIDMNYRYL